MLVASDAGATLKVGSCNGSMMNKTSRAIAAFAVAPFVPTSLYWAFYKLQLPAPRHFHQTHVFWNTVDVIFWTSVVVTLPLTLAIGLPAYVLIQKHSTLRNRHVFGISGAAGLVLGLLATAPVGGTLLGLSAGLTFWLIWHRDRDEKQRT
jgi:hypothetical protein